MKRIHAISSKKLFLTYKADLDMLLGPGRGGMPKPGARINPVVGVTHHELGMADLLTHDIKFCIHIWSRNDPVDTNY